MVHRSLARSYMQEAPVEGNKGGPIEKIDPPYRQKVRDEMLLTTTFSTSKTTSTTSRNTSESARSLRAKQIVQNQSFERDILFDSEIIERSFCCCTRTPSKISSEKRKSARRKTSFARGGCRPVTALYAFHRDTHTSRDTNLLRRTCTR